MYKNYHTHTWRCRHAVATEQEYIEAALKAGLRVLGFSDHVPMPAFPNPAYYSDYRMRPEQLPEYIHTLLSLRERYRGDIDIRIGFEAEYYPELFDGMMELLGQFPYDYLILGQHFLDNEWDTHQWAAGIHDADGLRRYVQQTITGMRTGVFSYLAHPDIARFDGDDAVYREEMAKICETALELDMPLECNLLGVRDHRHYPQKKFFRLAGEYGCKVILGTDAHDPEAFLHPTAEAAALAMLETCGVHRIVEDLPFIQT